MPGARPLPGAHGADTAMERSPSQGERDDLGILNRAAVHSRARGTTTTSRSLTSDAHCGGFIVRPLIGLYCTAGRRSPIRIAMMAMTTRPAPAKARSPIAMAIAVVSPRVSESAIFRHPHGRTVRPYRSSQPDRQPGGRGRFGRHSPFPGTDRKHRNLTCAKRSRCRRTSPGVRVWFAHRWPCLRIRFAFCEC